jgi:hypothetical protein
VLFLRKKQTKKRATNQEKILSRCCENHEDLRGKRNGLYVGRFARSLALWEYNNKWGKFLSKTGGGIRGEQIKFLFSNKMPFA